MKRLSNGNMHTFKLGFLFNTSVKNVVSQNFFVFYIPNHIMIWKKTINPINPPVLIPEVPFPSLSVFPFSVVVVGGHFTGLS